MKNLFLFESGSTKTTVLSQSLQDIKEKKKEGSDLSVRELSLTGYNPNRPTNQKFIDELKTLEIKKGDLVFFYGSGLGAEENKKKLKILFNTEFNLEINVFDDIIGAARALYQKQSGVLAILGTGACAAYYNGEFIEKRQGGYGYLIDDLGGGYELGKFFLSLWLNNQLPITLTQEFEKLLEVGADGFLSMYYELSKEDVNKSLALVANIVKTLTQHLNEINVYGFVNDYYELFFKRHLIPLTKDTKEIRFVGSLAFVFEKNLNEIAKKHGLVITKIMQYPAIELLKYHLKIINKQL